MYLPVQSRLSRTMRVPRWDGIVCGWGVVEDGGEVKEVGWWGGETCAGERAEVGFSGHGRSLGKSFGQEAFKPCGQQDCDVDIHYS